MPSEDSKILEFNQYQNPGKTLFIIYGYLQCLIKKADGCKNHPESSPTTKVTVHIPSDLSMFTISLFKKIENKHNIYRGKDRIERFFESLRQHAMNIINFKKKKLNLLTNSSRNHMKMQKSVIPVKKNWEINM